MKPGGSYKFFEIPSTQSSLNLKILGSWFFGSENFQIPRTNNSLTHSEFVQIPRTGGY
jgi:hypothetical protein